MLQDASARMYGERQLPMNHQYFQEFHDVLGALRSAGAPLLLGTDRGVPNVLPGFGEHREMELLSEAGLSNWEILQAATLNGAACLEVEDRLGSIEVGKMADLVLLRENPVENIAAMGGSLA